jgi:hypothetical protein
MTILLTFIIIFATNTNLSADVDTIPMPEPPPTYEERPSPPCSIPCVFDDEGNLVCPPCH